MPIAARLISSLRRDRAAPGPRVIERDAARPSQRERLPPALEHAPMPAAAADGGAAAEQAGDAVVSCKTGFSCLFRLGV
jgi:hypothetical protein